ncbi:MAG: GNAT family N-acetyltransferase [Thalassolituus sp.]|jgi:hypothetical protein|nr:MAG: GNAT family N-acetyltransferase [Oceanobacter sp.]
MSEIQYLPLNSVDIEDLLTLMNKHKTRRHLMNYPVFDLESIQAWVDAKEQIDTLPGCRVRAIVIDRLLAGWCAIQQEGGDYELAIILDEVHWGLGKQIFRELMRWAKELKHDVVLIHLLETRREYKFLRRQALEVSKSSVMGHHFLTYKLKVK